MRAEQREATRKQIVSAALTAIAEIGFNGVSTRQIAARANVSQGLLTYHFRSKEALWRAAADQVFALANEALRTGPCAIDSLEAQEEQQRGLIRRLVGFCAAHPEFVRFMLDHGQENSERSQWLVDTHLRPLYDAFSQQFSNIPKADVVHAFYVVAGASGLLFCARSKCEILVGQDQCTSESIDRHANYVVNMLVPPAVVDYDEAAVQSV